MAIACPYCDHRINLKAARPGRFRPRCPSCDRTFVLVIPATGAGSAGMRVYRESDPAAGNCGDTLASQSSVVARTPAPRRHAPVPEAVPAGSVAAASPQFGFAKTTPDPLKQPSANRSAPVLPVAMSSAPGGGESVSTATPAPPVEFTVQRNDVRGYRVERILGRGGMGTVFLARQLSLDRLVALKVMAKRWASDPIFVARFTREAYAAAQLSHPNIVHIHDIGEVGGVRFFSMEYVPGRSLADVVKAHGKLDPETAVGYTLQAARGLKHAHDRGMIHRDVKPDNLLLDDQGLIKVADLGLVKTRNSEFGPRSGDTEPLPESASGFQSPLSDPNLELTGVRIALGTPAYMSPEQCRDAAKVDHRADVYSLGCTLYVLVTGRPPFDGTTAVELMTKHAYEPIVPPEQIVARVPPELSAVIQRMMAKGADDRFQNMGEVIRTLEAWLGVHHAGTFTPREEQISQLEGCVQAFNTAPAAVLRGRVLTGFFTVTLLLAVLLLFFGKPAWASGMVGLVAQSVLAYFVLDGVTRKGFLFGRVRQIVLGLGWSDWGIAAAGVGLFALLLWMSGVFWLWAGFGLIGVGLAVGLRCYLDRQVAAERQEALGGCERLLRRLRAQGLDEEEVRQFIAKFSGRHWEEFFESLFGYEAKLAARAVLSRGVAAGPRERHAAWREPLLNAIDRIETARKQARERRLLEAVEQARLLAEGLAREEAERKARASADAVVREADKARRAEADRFHSGGGPQGWYAPPPQVTPLVSGVSNPDLAFEPARPDAVSQLVGFFVGPHVRAVLAVALVAACGLWAHQNGLIPGAEVHAGAQAAVESNDLSGLEAELQKSAALDAARTTEPLRLDGVAPPLTAWVDSFNVAAAGLLLFASLRFRGNLTAILVLLGAGITVAGHHFGIRSVEPVRDYHVALVLGSVVALVGMRVGGR